MENSDLDNTMETPPIWSTIRVNTLKITMEEARERMQAILDQQYEERKSNGRPKFQVQLHPRIPDLLLIRGSGPHDEVQPVEKEIYVDTICGSAVMRGADIYAPGVLGSNGHFSAGDTVSIYMDLDGRCKRGLKRSYDGKKQFLGNGTTIVSRTDIFTNPDKVKGIGVRMTESIWNHPRLDGSIVEDWGFVQNLPSVVCGHVLAPRSGDRVLDMCAAPGGKSTHLATLMDDQGSIVCIDSSANRVRELKRNVEALSIRCIEAYRMNALDLSMDSSVIKKIDRTPVSFQPETFDRILLDALCSCTGQRPCFKRLPKDQRTSHVPQQRKLLTTAYRLLKPGGMMVYSTCSLESEENENQIAWFLEEYPNMALEYQNILVGSEIRIAEFKGYAQKFDPREIGDAKLEFDRDTIGFFIAKMKKAG